MKKILHIENFGKLKSAIIDLQDFILFVGDNNSGKTYVMQLIYGLYDYISSSNIDIDEFKINMDEDIDADEIINANNIEIYIQKFNEFLDQNKERIIQYIFNKNLKIGKLWFEIDLEGAYFSFKVKNNNFRSFDLVLHSSDNSREKSIELGTSKGFPDHYLYNIVMLGILYLIFDLNQNNLYLPSSRAGLHLLYKDYFLSKGDGNFMFQLTNEISQHEETRLTRPVYQYLRFLQKWELNENTVKENTQLLNFLENYLIDGHYQKDISIEYIPKDSTESIPMYLTSSMISELLPYYYLIAGHDYHLTNHIMIDEAESCLHPKKQFELIRFLIRLMNQEKHIIVSTHSDSMAAKINNMVLISHQVNETEDFNALLSKYGLEKEDIFHNMNIKVYSFHNEKDYSYVKELQYDEKIGFNFNGFEDALTQLLDESKKIFNM